jgi:uncharacterized membrane protein
MGLLTAVLLLMAYTPLGYLNIGPLAITFNVIPVALAAITLGPVGGAIIGAVFGFTSFFQCFGMDAFGTVLASYSMLGTLVVTVLARTLAGFVAGLVYKLIVKKTTSAVAFPVIGFTAAALNTVLFTTSLMAFFGNTTEIASMRNGQNILLFMCAFVGINAVFEMIVCTAATTAVAAALRSGGLLRYKPTAAQSA